MILKNRILNGFLLKHRIKGKFMRNYMNDIKNRELNSNGNSELLSLIHSRHGHFNDIAFAFKWIETPEGMKFWSYYNSLYFKYYFDYE